MSSRPVDEKLVVMKLDHSNLVKNAAETTTIFGKLKDSLNKIPGVNLNKTAKEMGNIRSEANQTNLNRLAESVQVVAGRFTNLGIVGVTALQNITNRAVDAGINLAKSLSLDQVMSGFKEYELKIGSIGTVLSNTEWAGTDLEDVNRVLNDLNTYADQTIYNFGQMTENIGRFTAAGVGLEDSATAIKGLSNLAAASGSDVNQLNTAMYQMSQALASGKLNLMDWNSMVNAGMGGKKTQDALVETAKQLGKNVDLSKGFRESIQDGWLTSEVFLETLKKFGKDESMIEAATKVRTFTGFMDTLQESIGSGWATTMEHIFGDFEEATELWTNVSNAVTGWVGATADARNEVMKGVAEKGGFQNIFEGIANAIQPIIQIYKAVGDGFDKVFPPLSVDRIVALTQSFKEFTAGLKLSKGTVSQLTTVFQGLFSIFSTVWEIAKRLTLSFVRLIPEGTTGGLLNFAEKLAKMAIAFNESVKEGNALTKFIDGLGNVLSVIGKTVGDTVGHIFNFSGSLRDTLGGAIDWIVEKLRPVGKFLKETFSGLGGDDLLGAGTLVGIIAVVKSIVDKIGDLGGSFKGLTGGFKDVLDNAGEALSNFSSGVKTAQILLIATSVGILAVSLKLLEGIDPVNLTTSLFALTTALGVMIGAMTVISKFNITGGLGAATTLIALSTAVLIMASALKKLSDLDIDELRAGVGGLVGITATLTAAIVAISKLGGKIGASSLQLMALAGAVYILAEAVEELSVIDGGALTKSVVALGAIFTQLAVFLKVVDGVKFGVGSALGVLGIASALLIMTNAIESISYIDVPGLTKGLATIGILLTEIALFSNLTSGLSLMASATGLLILSGAVNALVPPIQTFSQMSLSELALGLGAMAAALAAVAGAGLLASGAIGGAVAVGVMAASLNLLVGPIQTFSQMSWEELIKGFVGLGGGIALLAGAAVLLSPAVAPMLGFGVALGLLGVAVLAAGAGIALFGAGLATLATMTTVSIAAIVSSLGLLLKGFAELIPAVVGFVVKLGSALLDGIAQLVPKLVNTVIGLITSLLGVISQHLSKFIEYGIKIIAQLIVGIGESIPKLVDAGMKAIVALINGLAEAVGVNGPQLISAVLNLLGEIILLVVEAGVQTIDALFGWIPGVKKVTAEIGETAEQYIRENFGAKEVAEEKGRDFATGLNSRKPEVMAAGEQIGNAAKLGMSSVDLISAGSTAAGQFATGIISQYKNVRAASAGLGTTADTAIRNTMQIHSPSKVTEKSGKNTGEGYAKGIKSTKKQVKKSAEDIAKEAEKAFKSKMEDAEYKFKMGEIDYAAYISEIEKIKSAYSKYPKLVQEANLEIKKIEESMSKEREELRKKEFENSKSWISERKNYNELSLADELKAWERIMERYSKGTEERKEAEREVYRLKNEINSKLVGLNEEYAQKVSELNQKLIDDEKVLNDEYNNTLEQRTQSLISFASIFDEVTKKSDVSGQQLISNLKSQVSTFEEWSKNIASLATKGIDQGLLEELRDMGPKAASEIAALNTLTETQLTEYSDLWKKKNELARTEATAQLESLRQETDAKILQLRTDSEKQLEIYKNEWLRKIREISEGTKNQFVSLNDDMNIIGQNAMDGLRVGLESKKGEVMDAAISIAIEIANAMNEALGIHSPSRVLMATGQYAGDGVIIGLGNRIGAVAKQAKNMAMTVVDTVNRFIDGFEIPELDSTFEVQAVINYDNSGLDRLDRTFNLIPDTSFANHTLKAVDAQNRQNSDKERSKQESTKERVRDVKFEQQLIFNTREMSPSETARKNRQASRDLVAKFS